jgi:toxin ParE1/3/4
MTSIPRHLAKNYVKSMALHKRYGVSRMAENDIDAIYRYTAQTWSGAQANTYQALIMTALEELASGTKIGRPAATEGYLSLRVSSHSIIYREEDGVILIARVLHLAMDVERHLKP